MVEKNVVIKNPETLLEAFSREIISSHERDNVRTSKFISYWLDKRLCRQPHHPPYILVQHLPGFIPTGPALLSIQKGISSSGLEFYYLKLFQVIKVPRQIYEITVISGAEHLTASSQSFDARPVEPVEPVWYKKFHTGGSGHRRPLYIFIFPEGETRIEIGAHYVSARGAINKQKDEIITVPGLYVYGDYGRWKIDQI